MVQVLVVRTSVNNAKKRFDNITPVNGQARAPFVAAGARRVLADDTGEGLLEKLTPKEQQGIAEAENSMTLVSLLAASQAQLGIVFCHDKSLLVLGEADNLETMDNEQAFHPREVVRRFNQSC